MDGTDVRLLRQHLGLTQEQFAHELGTTYGTIARWENGKQTPRGLYKRALEQFARRATRARTRSPD